MRICLVISCLMLMAVAGCGGEPPKVEKGDPGPPGPQGPTGLAGPPGPVGTVIRSVEANCTGPCTVGWTTKEFSACMRSILAAHSFTIPTAVPLFGRHA